MASAQRRSSPRRHQEPLAPPTERGEDAKPAANGTTQKSPQAKPTVVRQKITAAPSTSTPAWIMRTTAPAASASRTVVEYGHPSHSTWSRFWWGGGPYFGNLVPSGVVLPVGGVPNKLPAPLVGISISSLVASGIKFDLGTEKQRPTAKPSRKPGVYLPNDKGGKVYHGVGKLS